jgi:hypothetical protein
MIIYHGSNHRFRSFKIEKRLVENQSTLLNEGMGIYFSTNPEIACSYGKYLYTVEIPDKLIVDFTKKSNCAKYYERIISNASEVSNVDIHSYISKDMRNIIIDNLHVGVQCISTLGEEIYNILDSTEDWYIDKNISEFQREKVRRYLKKESNMLLMYIFNYQIPDIGVIKKPGLPFVKIISIENIEQSIAV